MRQTTITVALAVAILVMWVASVITANSPSTGTNIPAATSIDVMQMMRDAKKLPEEKFDAH